MKKLMIITLVLIALTLIVNSSIGKASVPVYASNSVRTSVVVPLGDWSNTYGGAGDEYAFSVVQAGDGGYALAGFTDSSGAGGFDFYLVKTDSAGVSSSSGGFNWSSITGYVVIAAIAIIIIAVVLLVLSRMRGGKNKP